MDGRDQPDTNVGRTRRKGDPSEAERRRLASTIFAEEDDFGTFSRGNLVPPPTDHPTEPRDDDPAAADPYFENLQRTGGGHEQGAATAPTDPETTAYSDQLTTQSAATYRRPEPFTASEREVRARPTHPFTRLTEDQ